MANVSVKGELSIVIRFDETIQLRLWSPLMAGIAKCWRHAVRGLGFTAASADEGSRVSSIESGSVILQISYQLIGRDEKSTSKICEEVNAAFSLIAADKKTRRTKHYKAFEEEFGENALERFEAILQQGKISIHAAPNDKRRGATSANVVQIQERR